MRPGKVPKEAKATEQDLEQDAVAEAIAEQTGKPADPRMVAAQIERSAVIVREANKRTGLNFEDRAHLIAALVDGVQFKDGTVKVMDWPAACAAVASDIRPDALDGHRAEIMNAAAAILRKREETEEHNRRVAATAKTQAAMSNGRIGFKRTGINLNEKRQIVSLMRRKVSFEDAVAMTITDPVDPAAIEGHREEIIKLATEGERPHLPDGPQARR